MNDDQGCATFLIIVLLFALAIGWVAINKGDYRREGYVEGRREQFCIDHAGAWDAANVRCLKGADTIAVQVKP